MAIGAVVSSRSFGSFSGSGRVHQVKQNKVSIRGESFSLDASLYAPRNISCNRLYIPSVNSSQCRSLYSLSFHFVGPSNGANSKSTFGLDGHDPLSVAYRIIDNYKVSNPQRRFRGICNVSPSFSKNSWNPPRKLDNLGFLDGQSHQSKHAIVNGIRADYKSEEFDITEAKLESLVTPEGEAVLVEGFDQAKPWWEQFPKRWVIVLLCFASFLLCNMDRVNMSIAILPMSKEFIGIAQQLALSSLLSSGAIC